MSIKKPSAVDSPYATTTATTPTVLNSAPGVQKVIQTVQTAAQIAASQATIDATVGVANRSYYANGQAAIDSLVTTSRTGVFAGSNVTLGLTEENYITYNQNYTGNGTVGGSNGQIQFNNNGSFDGSANLTFNGANLTVGGKITGGQLSTTGSVTGGNLLTAGQVSAVGNVTGNYFIGNGSQLTGINAGSSNKIFNGNSYANIANASGNLVVSANGSPWTFGTDGTLTFPENSGCSWPINTQRFGMGNIGAWLDGQWTIGEFSGNGVSGAVGIRIDPAIEGYTGITLPGSESSNTQPVQIYSTNGGNIQLQSDSNYWTFNADGTTEFPNNVINPGNNQPLTLRTQSSGNAYTIAYQSSNSWEAYAEDDNTEANSAYAWIKADLNTANTPRVFINNVRGGDGLDSTWTFDDAGNLTLPNGALLKDTSGDSVAFGQNAGANSQQQHSVAIGPNAGQTNQGEDSVAIGWNAAQTDQGQRAIAIGWGAGATSQQIWGQAYGQDAGGYNQNSGAIAMGLSAGLNLQSQEAIAIGTNAAYGGGEGKTVFNMQNSNTVRLQGNNNNLYPGMKVVGGSIGATSGIVVTGIIGGEDVSLSSDVSLNNGDNLIFYNQQGSQAVAVGSYSGEFLQGQHAVAVGYHAGQTRQGYAAVSIGEDAGYTVQGISAVAIGRTAGRFNQGNSAVAMGWNAGQDAQGQQAIAIGEDAGLSNQGVYSIAIGFKSGFYSQGNNSIILNATGTALNMATANSFTVAPVRASTLNNYSQDTGNVLYYNTFTHEVTTAPLNNITGDPFAANIYDSTANVTVWTASSDQVVGAKLTVRVVYASSGWTNTEMLDIAIAKNYPDGTPAFTVSNRVKTNPAYSDTLIDVTLTGGNVLQVISSALDGAGNNVYWTCSATSFNQTFD